MCRQHGVVDFGEAHGGTEENKANTLLVINWWQHVVASGDGPMHFQFATLK